jgi:predicted RNA polymerase sigma factor
MFHLAQSAAGDEITEYHIQSGIAACHCAARDYESTDWRQILELYDRLVQFDTSPVIALNRAIVVANLDGPKAGLDAVAAIPELGKLESYYLLYAALGEFESRRENFSAAADHFRQALKLSELASERAFLSKRIQACEERGKIAVSA